MVRCFSLEQLLFLNSYDDDGRRMMKAGAKKVFKICYFKEVQQTGQTSLTRHFRQENCLENYV